MSVFYSTALRWQTHANACSRIRSGLKPLQGGLLLTLAALMLLSMPVVAQNRFHFETACGLDSDPGPLEDCNNGDTELETLTTTGLSITLSPTTVELKKVHVSVENRWQPLELKLESPAGDVVVLAANSTSNAQGWLGDPDGDCIEGVDIVTYSLEDAPNATHYTRAPNFAVFNGYYIPEDDDFSAYDNTDPNGDWKLLVCRGPGGFFEPRATLNYFALTFCEPPLCTNPTDLTITGTLDTKVFLEYTSANVGSDYTIEVGPLGFEPGTATFDYIFNGSVTATTQAVTLDGLDADQCYQYYVKEDCGSNWVGPRQFCTDCAPIDPTVDFGFGTGPGHWEAFENGGDIPDCWRNGSSGSDEWSFVTNSTWGPSFAIGDHTPAPGRFFAFVDDLNTNTTDVTLTTPLFDITNLNPKEPYLSFWQYSGAWNGYNGPYNDIQVDVFDGQAWQEDIYSNNELITPWTKTELDMDGISFTGPVKWRFIVDQSQSTTFHDRAIDDVIIREAPLCANPSGINVINVLHNRATVEWISQNPGTVARVYWTSDDGANFDSIDVNVDINLTPGDPVQIEIDGLTGLTEYCIEITELCGSHRVGVGGEFCFSTRCDPVLAPLITQGGNMNNAGPGLTTPPACFLNYQLDISQPNELWEFQTASNAFWGPFITSDADGTGLYADLAPDFDADFTNLETRLIDISNVTTPILTFKVNSVSGAAGQGGQFNVDIFDGDRWNLNAFQYRDGDNRINGVLEQWEPFEVNMIRYGLDPDKPVMARFSGDPTTTNAGFTNIELGVDDVDIDQAGPCGTPFDLRLIGVTLDQAVLNWQFTPPVSLTGYELRYKEAAAADWEDTTVTANDVAVILNLTQGTEYEWQVRADCDGRGLGLWTPSEFFTTFRVGAICEYPTNVNVLPYVRTGMTTTGFGNYYDDLDGCNSAYMLGEEHVFEYVSPKTQVVTAKLTNTSGNTGIFIMDGCPNDATTNCAAGAEEPGGNPVIDQVLLEANTTYYIVVSTNPTPESTDFDIEIREIPCPDPVDIEVSNVTNTTAEFTWNALSVTKANWEVWVSTSSAVPTPGTGENVTAESHVETGLLPNTEYHFFLQEDCGGGEKSNIIGPFSFWTLRDYIDNSPMSCQDIDLADNSCDNRNVIPIQENITTSNLGVVQLEAVKLIIEHPDVSELDISLISPSGVEIELIRGEDVSGANLGEPTNCPNDVTDLNISGSTEISTGTSPYVGVFTPKGSYLDFNDGTPADSLWQLKICDTEVGNTGKFKYAELVFTPLPTVSVNDVTVSEAAGAMNFVFQLSAARNYPVSVDYDLVDITTTAGLDYTALGLQTVTFDPGQTSKTVTVNVINDALNEFDETFTLKLQNPVNVQVLNDEALGTIENDDPEPQLSISDITVDEQSGSMRFALSLSELSGRDITFEYQTEDIEAIGTDFGEAGDYIKVDLSTFTIPEGTQGFIEIIVLDDLNDELNETLKLTLSNPNGATIVDGEGIGTIVDNDNPPYVVVEEAAADEGNVFGDGAQVTFTARLTQASDKPISFEFSTVDNTAIGGVDYDAVTGQVVNITPGDLDTTFTVDLIEDLETEDYETFFILLANGTNVTIPAGGPITGTIINDDLAPLANTDNYSVSEDMVLTVSDPTLGVLSNDDAGTAGGVQTATLVESTLNGTILSFNTDGTFTYVPAPNFFGTDRFVYNVTDDANTSINGIVMINVLPVSDDPIITGIDDEIVCSGESIVFDMESYTTDIDDIVADFEFTFGANLVDIQGDISREEILFDVNPFSHEITVQPMTVNSGIFTIEFTATDKSGNTASDVMDLRVNARPKLTLDFVNACEDTDFDVTGLIELDFGSVDSIQWDIDDDGMPDTTATSFNFDGNRVGSYPITAEVFVSTGCNDKFTQQIEIFPYPDAKIYQVGNQLTASEGTDYQWYLDGTAISEEDGGKNQIFFANRVGDYTVDVINEGGCLTKSAVLILTVSALEDVENGIKLYPTRDVEDYITLEMNNDIIGGLNVTIMTIDGREISTNMIVKEGELVKHQLDVRTLPSGAYMVKVTNDEFTGVRRFVK